MTIKMRLDTDGLRALLRDNPELEVEIGKEVLNNIRNDVLTTKIAGKIDECLRSMVKSNGTWPATYSISSSIMLEAIQKAVGDLVDAALEEKISRMVSQRTSDVMRSYSELIARDIEKLMREALTPEMARDILRDKIF